MTALTAPRLVPSKNAGCGPTRSLPMAATKIFSGALVMINSSGYATKAAAASGNNALVVAGIAEETVDNSGGSAGDLSIRVRACDDCEAYGFTNDGSAAVDITHVGGIAYVIDDNTVGNAQTSTNRPLAGYIHSVDDDGLVYVSVPGRKVS
jgi:hypothetical protein